MIRWASLALALCLLAACANTSDTALPMVHPDDPTWQLVPDRLEFGALPK
jgi:outer membrane biogenesis lipoprotein LolB